MPRFVLLRHETPPGYRQGLHWDLMLEDEGKLLTWALDAPLAPGAEIAATKLSDHRPLYLDYEGEVAQGRGEVQREDAGQFEWLQRGENLAIVLLHGATTLRVELQQREGDRWNVAVDAQA